MTSTGKLTNTLRAAVWMTSTRALESEHEEPPEPRTHAVWDKAWSKADWGGSWNRQTKYATSRAKNRSAPLLPASEAPHVATWYSGKMPLGPSSTSCWRSLGATWRDWETDGQNRQLDDHKDYVNGCVPHWSKGSRVRVKGLLEHELTWAYYRMRRHEGHPQRQAVGENLPNDCVGEKMRFGRGCTFKFWRDLRPPFAVKDVRRVDDGLSDDVPASAVNHPDGELHTISYECAIEYFAERLLEDDSEQGTFGNKVYGVAQVRIPNAWPHKRPIRILDWGNPTLNPADVPKERQTKPKAPPPKPQPKAGALDNERRMVRQQSAVDAAAMRVGKKTKEVHVPDLQSLDLGQHASLPRMTKAHSVAMRKAVKDQEGDADLGRRSDSEVSSVSPERKPRKHRVFTPACGFITYEG